MLNMISLFIFASVGILAVVLIWNPRSLKEPADRLCAKHIQVPTNITDAYYVMFLRQFGVYIVFIMYAVYLHPDLSVHVWKVMSGCILVKTWHVQGTERPIPLTFHVAEFSF